jgi:hypothetical protein
MQTAAAFPFRTVPYCESVNDFSSSVQHPLKARAGRRKNIWQGALLVSLALTHVTSAALSFVNRHAPMFCLWKSAFFAL